MVEKTYSDDEQNIIIVTYATEDGRYAFQKELALPSIGSVDLEHPSRMIVDRDNLSSVDDPETRDWYRDAVAERQSKG